MAQFTVSSESMSEVSTRLTAGAVDLQTHLAALKSRVDALGGEWEGAGSSAFGELYAEFTSAGQRLDASLQGIAGMLGRAAEHYAASEAQVAAAFRGA